MSSGSLQLALAVLGGLGLAGLVAYNAWTTRKNTPKSKLSVAPKTESTALANGVEPTFASDDPPTVPNPLASELYSESEALLPATGALAPVIRRYLPRIDPLIDAIVTLTLDHPIFGEQALNHIPLTRRAGAKPFLIEGLDEHTGQWDLPQAGHRYKAFQAGVQLANRTGAINEIEYSEFIQKLQTFADALGAAIESPDMLEVVARGRELDTFASEYDAQLALRLKAANGSWSVGYIQQQAAKQGFLPSVVAGRLVLPAAQEEGAPPVLTLSFDAQAVFTEDPYQAPIRELILSFDVPQTAFEQQPFADWRDAAQALAQLLDASLTDDADNLLPAQAFETIEKDLQRLYTALAERDLAAGSLAARRLFS